jgi:hypothetical protein
MWSRPLGDALRNALGTRLILRALSLNAVGTKLPSPRIRAAAQASDGGKPTTHRTDKDSIGRRGVTPNGAFSSARYELSSTIMLGCDRYVASRWPHSPQNLAPAATSLPHVGQGPPDQRSDGDDVAAAGVGLAGARRRRTGAGVSGIAAG